MKPSTIIFDRDHTLVRIDPAPLIRRFQSIVSEPAIDLIQFWQSWDGGFPATPADEPVFWTTYWTTLVRRYGLDEALIPRLVNELGMQYHTAFQVYDDTLETLAALKGRGLRLAILTNFELSSIERVLESAGITAAWFDAIVSAAAVGHLKPHPEAYLHVARQLGEPPEACVLVDDDFENVIGARKVGMRAVCIYRSSAGKAPPEPYLRNLAELVPWLDAIERSQE